MKSFFSRIIFSSLFVCLSIFFIHSPVFASESNEFVAMFDQTSGLPHQVPAILTDQPDFDFKLIPEVGLLKVRAKTEEQANHIKSVLKSNFENEITFFEDMNVQPKKVGVDSEVILQRLKQTGVEPNDFNADGSDYYEQWSWGIKQVTEQGRSFEEQPGSHNTVVAVIDSGIDPNHPDLQANLIARGESFVPGVTDTIDRLGHGTMVAGSIAANGKLLGVGPNLGIVPYKVFHQGSGESTWVIDAIIEAAKDDVDVINLSLGTYKSLKDKDERLTIKAYMRAILFARKAGTVIVAASGNGGYNLNSPKKLAEQKGLEHDLLIYVPGNLPGVMMVGATNRQNELTAYSNYGHQVDVSAPGGDYGPRWEDEGIPTITSFCLTTYPTTMPQSDLSSYLGFDKGYELTIGTSLAAPKVSAAAGLLIEEAKEQGRSLKPQQVVHLLKHTANSFADRENRKKGGAGIVNVNEALLRLNR